MKALWLRLLLKVGIIDRIAWLRSKGLTIGQHCFILNDVYIDPGAERYIVIGDSVTLAPFVKLIAHDASTKRALGVTRFREIIIEEGVFVGAGTLILPGVRIGHHTIIGAGSVVTHDIPENAVACGNPAVVKTDMESFLKKRSA